MDMFVAYDAGWEYTTEIMPDTVVFYEEGIDVIEAANTITIMAMKKTASNKEMMNAIHEGIENSYDDLKWLDNGEVIIGQYTGLYESYQTSEFSGRVVVWQTDDRLYYGSLTSVPGQFEQMQDILEQLLFTFKTLDELEE